MALPWLLAACDVPSAEPMLSVPSSLVEPEQWQDSPSRDAFADLRPADVECDPVRGLYLQRSPWGDRFEINTAWCNYATVEQPLLEPLAAGDTVEVRVWHFDLTGAPAEAYVGVAVAGEIEWERIIPIPSEGGLIAETFEVSEAVEAGTPIQFHVHNHGNNTWELVSIEQL